MVRQPRLDQGCLALQQRHKRRLAVGGHPVLNGGDGEGCGGATIRPAYGDAKRP